MEETRYWYIRIPDPDGNISEKVKALAEADLRTMGNEVIFLINQEYNRRFPAEVTSQPITVQ
jgi:hypothetical protein